MKKLLIWLGLLLLMSVVTAAAQDDDVLHVDASQSQGTISPYVYGANLGQGGLIPQSMISQAQALNLKYTRYGGGNSDRRDLDHTTIGLFVAQSRQIGAEPAMTVRLYGGTPQQAALCQYRKRL